MARPPDLAAPSACVYAAVLLVSLGVIVLEICAVQVFAVLFYYHFVFAVVSFSLLGLGLGAILAIRRSDDDALVFALVGAAVSQVSGMPLIFLTPLLDLLPALVAVAVLLAVPFLFAGWFLAGVFSRWPRKAGALYGADLLGAAAGCLLSIGLMNAVGPLQAILIGAFGAAGGAMFWRRVRASLRALAAASFALVSALLIGSFLRPWGEIHKIPLAPKQGVVTTMVNNLLVNPTRWKILASRWDSYTRTDVVAGEDPDVRWVYTNGETPTTMARAGGRRTQPEFLRGLLGFLPFQAFPIEPQHRVLCIAAGGGLDVLITSEAGARDITAVDINRALPGLLEEFRDYHGDVYARTGAELIVAEGRHYLKKQTKPFDVIYMALSQTSTAAGRGLSLVESYIHTVEATEDMLRSLTPNGRLIMVFDQEMYAVRSYFTVLEALARVFAAEANAGAHVAVISKPAREFGIYYNHLLLVHRAPLSAEQTARLGAAAQRHNFRVRVLPQRPPDPPFDRTPVTIANYLGGLWNLRPVGDDSPFYLDVTFGLPEPLRWLLVCSTLASLLLAMWTRRSAAGGNDALRAAFLPSLVVLLGAGFMIAENVVIQRFILLLGYPTLTLAVVICGILAGGAAGSLWAQRLADTGQMTRIPRVALLALPMLILFNYLAPPLTQALLPWPLIARILLVLAGVGALGFALGLFFPTALRLAGEGNGARPVAQLWAINGVSSVLGGALTLSLAKLMNFTFTLNVALAFYAIAVFLLWRLTRSVPRQE